MKLRSCAVTHYRSIESINISFPPNRPVILFGPNNAGKSNILSAINRVLGERYPTYIEMLDSDYYMRDKDTYPTADIVATFDSPLYFDKYGHGQSTIAVRYGNNGDLTDNLLHDGTGKRVYPSNEQRAACQSYLIDAERNIQSAFNYSSQYSLLSKFSRKIHEALSSEHKSELSSAFEQIKSSFEKTTEFSFFFKEFSEALTGSVKGFVHSLAVDFSAYDPNNYAKSMRIFAKEGDCIRGFEEFGTGEQQVLLMAFVKAYMKVFSSEHFVLIIEEPEAHLHPLAQKWLKEYISEMCESGIQVVISTHSTDFIDAEFLEGLVRVYKVGNTTKAKQLTRDELCSFCIASGAPAEKTTPDNVIDFYSTKLFSDQLKGMFAETIILVEGATEFFALPEYLKKKEYSLAEHGVEIINCRGKDAIPLFWRLFKAYGYSCYAIFDCDKKPIDTAKVFSGLISRSDWVIGNNECCVEKDYAFFGKDFESYFRSAISDYDKLETQVSNEYQITTKPGKAKAVAQHSSGRVAFIDELIEQLNSTFPTS